MQLYRHKNLTFHFIVLNANNDISNLKTTISSLREGYPNIPYLCVLPSNSLEQDRKEISKIARIEVGGETITSLINAGINNGGTDWNLVVTSGAWVKNSLNDKYSLFIENQKDILFPVINRKMNFIDSSINGMFVHKTTFQEIGDFVDYRSLEISKAAWAAEAVRKGCHFKGIIGAKIF